MPNVDKDFADPSCRPSTIPLVECDMGISQRGSPSGDARIVDGGDREEGSLLEGRLNTGCD